MRNWRTTVLGIVAIAAAGFGFANDALPHVFAGNLGAAWDVFQRNWDGTVAAIAAGWAMIHAADAKDVSAPTP